MFFCKWDGGGGGGGEGGLGQRGTTSSRTSKTRALFRQEKTSEFSGLTFLSGTT